MIGGGAVTGEGLGEEGGARLQELRRVWVDAPCVLISKNKRAHVSHRGGWRRGRAYPTAKRDICAWMRKDRRQDVRFTTM